MVSRDAQRSALLRVAAKRRRLPMNVGIIGGGISGLTLQRFLKHPCEVLEAAPVPGGLCRTFWKDGFGYDIGGHILFSKHQHVTDLVNQVLGDNINYCK